MTVHEGKIRQVQSTMQQVQCSHTNKITIYPSNFPVFTAKTLVRLVYFTGQLAETEKTEQKCLNLQKINKGKIIAMSCTETCVLRDC